MSETTPPRSGFSDVDRSGSANHLIEYLDAARLAPSVISAKEWSLDRLDLQPGLSALDIGCGTGEDVVAMLQRVTPGGRSVGIDNSEFHGVRGAPAPWARTQPRLRRGRCSRPAVHISEFCRHPMRANAAAPLRPGAGGGRDGSGPSARRSYGPARARLGHSCLRRCRSDFDRSDCCSTRDQAHPTPHGSSVARPHDGQGALR